MKKLIVVALFALPGLACNRTHMSPTYGQSLRHALAAQVINPQAGASATPDKGLDPEEASAVLETYRK